ncbi:PAF1 [Cordylochernes scorpioides]|uniref:RNA polymerase II-associated factor 1 homolog n=1 Tax=Cordylochernes scorpioides TaxID=51811 RepID=A0ABY6L0K4_9ARAC|nr:PAF1 [Cordylochernes scorpioides]
MPPTIQTGSSSNTPDRNRKYAEKKSEMVCRIKYSNTLPDIPFDPKFIVYPFDNKRYTEYKPTSLEKSYKHELLTEHDLGVKIDLIRTDAYSVDPNAVLSPADEKLLEDEAYAPQDSKRSRHHNKAVPWLKKTEYISTEFNRYGNCNEKTETKVGYNVKRLFKEENIYMDKESQINAINKTFEDCKKPVLKHYSKPNVQPVEILPLFPDFDLWRYPFAQVTFDSDPAPKTQTEEMSQAMIRGVVDESGEQFVAYFLPTEENIKKRKRDAEENQSYQDDEEYEYKMAREYNWNVKNKASKGYEENYFFTFRDGAVYYNELETRVRLNKRRLKPGVPPNNSKLVVKHRPVNEKEFKTQEIRLTQLEHPQEEEDEPMEIKTKKKTKPILMMRIRNPKKSDDSKNSDSDASKNDSDDEGKSSGGEKSDKESSASDNESEKSAKSDNENEDDNEKSASPNKNEESRGSDSSGSEDEAEEKKSTKSSSAASSSSGSEQSSDNESDAEDQKQKDEAEIFGSESD